MFHPAGSMTVHLDTAVAAAAAAALLSQFNATQFNVYQHVSPTVLVYSTVWPLRTDAHVITGTYQAYDMK